MEMCASVCVGVYIIIKYMHMCVCTCVFVHLICGLFFVCRHVGGHKTASENVAQGDEQPGPAPLVAEDCLFFAHARKD